MENIKKYNEFLNEWKITFKKSELEKEVEEILKNLENIKNLRKVDDLIIFRYNDEPYIFKVHDESENIFKHSYDMHGTEIDTRLGKKLYNELKKINKNI